VRLRYSLSTTTATTDLGGAPLNATFVLAMPLLRVVEMINDLAPHQTFSDASSRRKTAFMETTPGTRDPWACSKTSLSLASKNGPRSAATSAHPSARSISLSFWHVIRKHPANFDELLHFLLRACFNQEGNTRPRRIPPVIGNSDWPDNSLPFNNDDSDC